MTYVKLAGGRIFDPANRRNDVTGDIFIHDGRIAADPGPGAKIDKVIDISGRVVMAGGIDIHSHICGGKMNLARTLMTAEHRESGNILIAIRANGDIWMDRRQVDLREVRPLVERLHIERPDDTVIVIADKAAKTGLLAQVMDEVKLGGIQSVAIGAGSTGGE